jgi:hypothetical protein
VGPVLPVGPVTVLAAPVGPVTVLAAPVGPVFPVGPVTVLAAPVGPVLPVGPVTVLAAPVDPVLPVGPVGPLGPVSPVVAPEGPVGPVCPQIVDDLIADHGPFPALVFARTLKKYCVTGARPYAVKDNGGFAGIFAEGMGEPVESRHGSHVFEHI